MIYETKITSLKHLEDAIKDASNWLFANIEVLPYTSFQLKIDKPALWDIQLVRYGFECPILRYELKVINGV